MLSRRRRFDGTHGDAPAAGRRTGRGFLSTGNAGAAHTAARAIAHRTTALRHFSTGIRQSAMISSWLTTNAIKA